MNEKIKMKTNEKTNEKMKENILKMIGKMKKDLRANTTLLDGFWGEEAGSCQNVSETETK